MLTRLTKFLAVFVFAAAGPAMAGDDLAPMQIDGATTVDADAFIELFQSTPDLIVVDSRKPADYAEAHLQKAVSLPNTETNADSLASVVPSISTPVMFYCNGITCGRAADAVQIAVDAGYENVYYYAKGMKEWNDRGLPTVSE